MVRSTACTISRTKEWRIRLSPNTAIQFYDLQDRLGYDRASMVIDWLMKEAKVSIDALYGNPEFQVPASTAIFNPNSESFHCTLYDQIQQTSNYDETSGFLNHHPFGIVNPINRFPQEINLLSASKDPFDFTWNNPNYNRADQGYGFVNGEPLQSSFDHSYNNGFLNDGGLVGFCFQEEIHVEEDEKDNVGLYVPHGSTSV